jgi:hypothetical protein
MDRRPLFFTILILTISIGSSFYLSWAVDRGMGEISVERVTIETSPGHSINLLIYSPRSANHYEPMPVVLTIHGLTGTKEGLYAFNVELARRNFTVVSLDLPGHGDSTLQFDLTDTYGMALDAYFAVRYVQTTYTNVDNQSYGVLTHSLGFRIALELRNFPIAPKAYVAVGDVGKVSNDEYVDFPGNLLFVMGSYDEIVTRADALEAIRTATGNPSAEAGITYGSLDNQTAYRLVFGPSNHVFEVIDKSLVSEAVSWLVQGVQGENQILLTRDPTDLVFFNKSIATVLATFFIFVGIIPVMWLTYSFIPEKWRSRQTPIDIEGFNSRKTFEISSILGASVIIIFIISALIGLNLENIGFSWLSSMSGTGLVLFLIISPIVLLTLMYLVMGKENENKALQSVGIIRGSISEVIFDILRGIPLASTGIIWLSIWLGLAGASQTQPHILLEFIRWPVGIRWTNLLIFALLSVPFFLLDAAWIRGIQPSVDEMIGKPVIEYDWSESYRKVVSVLIILAMKFAFVVLLTIVTILGTTSVGVEGGRIVLIGVVWIRVFIILILTSIITAWSSLKLENTWSAIMVNAFLLALVLVTTIPLI